MNSNLLSCFILWMALLFVMYTNRKIIQHQLSAFLRNKFGFVSVNEFRLSFRKNRPSSELNNDRRLKIYFTGVHFQLPFHHSATEIHQKIKISKSKVSILIKWIVSMPFVKKGLYICLRFLLTTVNNHVAFYVRDLSIQLDSHLVVNVNYIYFDSSGNSTAQYTTVTARLQIGPVQLKSNNASLCEMVSSSLMTVTFPFQTTEGKCLSNQWDFNIQLGKAKLNLHKCLEYVQQYHVGKAKHNLDIQLAKTNRTNYFEKASCFAENSSSFRFSCECISLTYIIAEDKTVVIDLNTIILVFHSLNHVPRAQFSSETIVCHLAKHRILTVPHMEFVASLMDDYQFTMKGCDQSSRLQQLSHHISTSNFMLTDLITMTWTIHEPIIIVPLGNQAFRTTVFHILQYTTSKVEQTTPLSQDCTSVFEKRIQNLPMCTFAIILNSPRLELLDVDDQKRNGYMTSKRWIIRLSGEYLAKRKNNTGNYDDVPSSSSSTSSSNLESLFAQEEYRWLSSINLKASSARLVEKKHESMYEFYSESESPLKDKRNNSANRWLNLMGRISRRQDQLSSQMHHINSKFQGTYRVSAKVIVQKASIGYYQWQANGQQEHIQNEFIRMKNTVLIFKSNMSVLDHGNDTNSVETEQEKRWLEVIFSSKNSLQSEIAIDKPVLYLWEDVSVPASIFWIRMVPVALLSLTTLKQNTERINNKRSNRLELLTKNITFSLDVTHGSIVVMSTDATHTSPVQVPSGYIDNTPKNTIHTRTALNTEKFTLVCENLGELDNKKRWNIHCHAEKLYVNQSSRGYSQHDALDLESFLTKDEKQHVILWVPQLNLAMRYQGGIKQKNIFITIKVQKYGISYSIRNHYVCLLLIKSLRDMRKHLAAINREVMEDDLRQQQVPNSLALRIHLDIKVGRGDLHIVLPLDTTLYLRIDNLTIKHSPECQDNTANIRNLMLLGKSCVLENKWEQLIEVDDARIMALENTNGVEIKLKAKKIFATIPYKFILSKVIDSVVGLIKASKELYARILGKEQLVFTFFGPKVNNQPITIPHIQIKVAVFSIHFDDDPFEAKLRNILRTGRVEQEKRLAYQDEMKQKVQDLLAVPSGTFSSASSLPPAQHSLDQSHPTSTSQSLYTNSSSNNSDNLEAPFSEQHEIEDRIKKSQHELFEYFSALWVKYINKTNKNESEFFEKLHGQEHYRNQASAAQLDHELDGGDTRRHDRFPLSNTFIIDILPRPLYPPLANFTAQSVQVRFKPIDFPLDEAKSFIHTIGGGVPLDNDFSIIVPFHLSIKAGMTWIKVRDYPLPLLYVPPPSSESKPSRESDRSAVKKAKKRKQIAWELGGNYVAADELGNSGGSRVISIPIVPNDSSGAPGYCLSAVRTTSPLKFYSEIDYKVLSGGMSTICWSISYSPAVQDILRVLDTLTPSQVDPSPPLGFWDKVRFMIHSRINISFTGGGDLAFIIKGTRDPYLLHGRGSGVAKIWSDDVAWLLGYKTAQKEFMQIISKSYSFGVPDLLHGGYVPHFPDSFPFMSEKIQSCSEHKFLKMAVKLTDGIRMGIGLSYERLSCYDNRDTSTCVSCKRKNLHPIDQCRSSNFSPHYNVLYQSVQHVKAHHDIDTYDAFKGFRSDFIHLSFSVVKLKDKESNTSSPILSCIDDPDDISQNAMYLSPCFIDHFKQWYRLFGSPISIPIRRGKLFREETVKSRSFGELLDTIKYKILIDPLAIGLFCTDERTYLKGKGDGTVGLKARVHSFRVDLHQQKEVIASPDNKPQPKTERNFHEAEIELTDIDLRIIKVNRRRNKATSAKSSGKSVSESVYTAATDYSYYNETIYSIDDDASYNFQWVDAKDFVVLDPVPQNPTLSHLNVEMHPFAFSPLFYFVRQNDEEGASKRKYLRQTHDCTLGKSIGMNAHEFQKEYLHKRAFQLDRVIEEHDKQLDIVIHAMSTNKYVKGNLKKEYNILKKKLEHLRFKRYMLHTYIGQLILETELNMPVAENKEQGSPKTTASSINHYSELERWETLMGRFKVHCYVHNPQIILNNSTIEGITSWREFRTHRSVQEYNLSSQCLKFLEDLVETAKSQQQWNPEVSNSQTDDYSAEFSETSLADEESNKIESLIDKLLFERSNNFIAYNEREENNKCSKQDRHTSTSTFGTQRQDVIFEEDIENVNDPDYQYQSIPDFYKMHSESLFHLINAQVVFQSDTVQNHLVLLTNERILVKRFNIIDNSNTEKDGRDICSVKKRIITSLDNSELIIAKKMPEIASYSSLTQTCYGQFQGRHWAVWVPPEQMWHYRDRKFFENFQRIATHLSGTMQNDFYNHIRIKMNSTSASRKTPFEDRINTIHLHFAQLKLTLSSLQSHILYYTLSSLVPRNDRSVEAKRRLDRSREILLTAERSDLAETVAQVKVLQNRSRFLLDMHKKFIYELSSLDSLGLLSFKRNKRKLCEDLEKLFYIVEAIRSIQTNRRSGTSLGDRDNAKQYIFTSNNIIYEAVEDDNHQNPLCNWTLKNIKFTFLDKSNGSSKRTLEIDKVHVKNTTKSPVFIDVLDAYVDPSDSKHPDFSRHKMVSGVLESLPPVGGIPIVQHLEIHLLPLRLQISTAFALAIKNYFIPSDSRNTGIDIVSSKNHNDEEAPGSENDEDDENEQGINSVEESYYSSYQVNSDQVSLFSSSKREGSFTSFDFLSKKVRETLRGKPKVKADELTIMKRRSQINCTFIYVRVPSTKHCLSLQGPSQNTIYNLYNFLFKQPKIEYRNKTWSINEMVSDIQKQFIRAIVRHGPELIKRKLLLRSNSQKMTATLSTVTNTTESRMPSQTRNLGFMAEDINYLIKSSDIDLTDDSYSFNDNSKELDGERDLSYCTEEEASAHIEDDIKSLYSNDSEHEESIQAVKKKPHENPENDLLNVYMKTYKVEEEKNDEILEKGKVIFGEHYNRF
ncbi:MAG: golgi-body localization protein domain-containing protein [Benjaminiella poitrasii]|nr:MAG: golgi-body localization protein domain-containing protein [Benjaminiella poitrasii]